MNSNNIDILGASLSQGQVFRKQQQNRMLNNNDVVTHNTKNKQTGKTNIAPAMAAISATIIEPFSQNTDNGSKNYKPLSLQDIEADDSVIKSVNDNQNAQTRQSILSYSNVSQNLNNFQENVTSDAKAYNHIKKTPGLLNKPYLTSDNKTIMVNNAGVVNTLTGAKEDIPFNKGIDISKSTQNPQPAINYFQVENAETGSNIGLYDKQLSSKRIELPKELPKNNSGYKLEGENVFVIYPYPNTPDEINKNMKYIGAFNISSLRGLNRDEHMPTETTLNCLQRAVDKGFSWCGMTTYGNVNRSGKHQGGGGKCMIGNLSQTSVDYAYRVITIPQTGSNTILKFPEGQGYNSLTFAADGILYAGYNVNYGLYKKHDKFLKPITKEFNFELDPVYGGTINNLTAFYAYNQGNWNSLKNFPGNPNTTAEPSGTLQTMRNYEIDVPQLGFQKKTYKGFWGSFTYNVPYIYTTKETRQQLAAPNISGGNLAYINYKCGKRLTKKPIVKGGVNAGEGFNVDCSELYGKYPSFTLELSDVGILTIRNTTSISGGNTESREKEFKMSFEYNHVMLTNGIPALLNKPRPDWVNGSINKGNTLTSNSKSNHSINENQWISSPNGFCRLILKPGGVLDLEYSEDNVIRDADGNLVGRDSSSVALYSIANVNTTGLGESASIDINGAVNPYPRTYSLQDYDNVYTKVQDYIPLHLDNNNTNTTSTSRQQCEDKCNNSDKLCYGYIYGPNLCNIVTSSTSIIGNNSIDRIPTSGYDTYIRNPKFPRNDNSCRKTLDATIGTDAYSYYLNNGITTKPPTIMTPQTKCNLGKVLDKQITELKQRNVAVVQKGNEIKNQFGTLFNKENQILKSISENSKTSQENDKHTTKAVNEIKRIKNAQITKSASEKDSELLLISDNYKYVILGIVSLLVSLATIKGLRMASS